MKEIDDIQQFASGVLPSYGTLLIGNIGTDPQKSQITVYEDYNGTKPIQGDLKLNSDGRPINLNGEVFTPYTNVSYSINWLDNIGVPLFEKWIDRNIDDGLPGFIENTFTSVAAAVADLTPNVGDVIRTSQYYSGSGIGGGVYQIVADTSSLGRDFVPFADFERSDGRVLKLLPMNPHRMIAEQCGVTYGGVGVVETDELQAAVDLGTTIRLNSADTGGAFECEVNGYIRIDGEIDVLSGRCIFVGVSTARSRIIWTGGNSTGTMINFNSASWGGLKDIRIQGFDQADGQTPMADGVEHLLDYTFIDFNHVIQNVHFVTGYSDAIRLRTTSGSENALTNYNLENIFFGNLGEGYMIKIEQGLGGKRVININGLTANNINAFEAQPDSGGIVDTRDVNSGFSVSVRASRIEYNAETKATDFAFFNFGNTSIAQSGRSSVNLDGVVGFMTGNQSNQCIVRAAVVGGVTVTESGCNMAANLLIEGGEIAVASPNARNYGGAGGKVPATAIGKSSIISGNFVERTGAGGGSDNPAYVKRGDLVLCNDGLSDFMVPVLDENDDYIYSFAATGQRTCGRINGINSGSNTTTIATDEPGLPALIPGLAVRIPGAGVAGGNLDTYVTDINTATDVITFLDAASTTVAGLQTMNTRGAPFMRGYWWPRATLPTGLQANDEGARCYALDIDCWATWSGNRWMFDSNHHVTTANRPVYTSNTQYTGRSVFDITLGQPVWWTGTQWVDATGTPA